MKKFKNTPKRTEGKTQSNVKPFKPSKSPVKPPKGEKKMTKEELKDLLNHWINLFVKYEADIRKPFDLSQQQDLAEYLSNKIQHEEEK